MVPIFVQHSEMSGLVRMVFFQPTFWVQLEFTIGPPPYYNCFIYKKSIVVCILAGLGSRLGLGSRYGLRSKLGLGSRLGSRLGLGSRLELGSRLGFE